MALVEWSDELSVGIQEIDEQHKVLVGLLNDLHRSIHERHGTEASRAILDKLSEYTRIHFAVEQSLMRVVDYPGYEEHKKEHEELIGQLVDFQRKVVAGGGSISFQLLHFLKMWLTHHILESDKEYTPHFLKMGIRSRSGKSSWFQRIWQ